MQASGRPPAPGWWILVRASASGGAMMTSEGVGDRVEWSDVIYELSTWSGSFGEGCQIGTSSYKWHELQPPYFITIVFIGV